MSIDEWMESVAVTLNGEPVTILDASIAGYVNDEGWFYKGDVFYDPTVPDSPVNGNYSLQIEVPNPGVCGYDNVTSNAVPAIFYDHISLGLLIDVPEHEHDYKYVSGTKGTCVTAGSSTYTCSICGNSYTQSTGTTAHRYTSFTSNGNRTHTATCSVCGHSETQSCTFSNSICTKCGYQVIIY